MIPSNPPEVLWRTDDIQYNDPPEGKRDRFIWLITTDREGRWDKVTVGLLHGKHTKDFEAERIRYLKWFRGNRQDPAPGFTIVPWLNVPILGVDDLLSNWWNIKCWAEMQVPEPPSGS